ncbi:F0F1 ATP synthase subunit A [Marinobacterium lutimaris]|uniref:ATP synthase subunit a n=1 Tax=Marinobacterium lutimaris TaxID=568106 RepID=A0A1H5X7H2_9GAMM|nr:F0F1 ATP synthase subunit A [Marinobacterium lutimaris]SEG07327.1 ATP synthase F0 subcomplex A subunit [Marinobacterium lutimaris]
MQENAMFSGVVFRLGPVEVTGTVITTWAIIALLSLVAWLISRDLHVDKPSRLQTLAEGVLNAAEEAIRAVAPDHVRLLLPFITTLWIFIVIANLVGLIPGLHSPTRDLSATSALALIVFFSVHWYGIRDQGLSRYLKHYLSPTPLMLPFHIVSEISRTIALAVRLFGNMLSLETAALLILVVAGFLAPIPILMLHIIEALVQAYIFGMLALIYVAGGLQSQQLRAEQQTEPIETDSDKEHSRE